MNKLAKRTSCAKNNKGFSLIELIIVIAIMAALIAILAPQYLKYVEKSRVAADQSTLDELVSAVKVAASDPDETSENGDLVITYAAGVWTIGGTAATTLSDEFVARVTAAVGSTTFKLKSKNADTLATGAGIITISVAATTYAVSCTPDYTAWSAS